VLAIYALVSHRRQCWQPIDDDDDDEEDSSVQNGNEWAYHRVHIDCDSDGDGRPPFVDDQLRVDGSSQIDKDVASDEGDSLLLLPPNESMEKSDAELLLLSA
jgi:hypothetical protein